MEDKDDDSMCPEVKAGFARFFAAEMKADLAQFLDGKCTVEHTNGEDYPDPTQFIFQVVK